MSHLKPLHSHIPTVNYAYYEQNYAVVVVLSIVCFGFGVIWGWGVGWKLALKLHILFTFFSRLA